MDITLLTNNSKALFMFFCAMYYIIGPLDVVIDLFLLIMDMIGEVGCCILLIIVLY